MVALVSVVFDTLLLPTFCFEVASAFAYPGVLRSGTVLHLLMTAVPTPLAVFVTTSTIAIAMATLRITLSVRRISTLLTVVVTIVAVLFSIVGFVGMLISTVWLVAPVIV